MGRPSPVALPPPHAFSSATLLTGLCGRRSPPQPLPGPFHPSASPHLRWASLACASLRFRPSRAEQTCTPVRSRPSRQSGGRPPGSLSFASSQGRRFRPPGLLWLACLRLPSWVSHSRSARGRRRGSSTLERLLFELCHPSRNGTRGPPLAFNRFAGRRPPPAHGSPRDSLLLIRLPSGFLRGPKRRKRPAASLSSSG